MILYVIVLTVIDKIDYDGNKAISLPYDFNYDHTDVMGSEF